jgi:3-phenylpropionate/cinnamic acid dioxygenase small subunit
MQDATIREIEQFLYREARLLDNRQYHAWLDLFTDDVRYWMPVRTSRYAKISKSVVLLDEAGYDETDIAKEDEQAIMDEDKASLQIRVARLDTGMAWAEDPPSLTRHFLSNIEVEAGDTPSEFRVFCNFIVYRSRGDHQQDFYVGHRQDLLRRESGGKLQIARRKIVLDQNVLLAKNVSTFF